MDNVVEIFTDGGSRGNPGNSASAFVVIKHGEVYYSNSKYLGVGTNNNAEYQAVILALNWFFENMSDFLNTKVNFYLDSELVVNQLNGKYRIKNENIKLLVFEIFNLKNKIQNNITFTAVRREKNKLADQLVNLCLDGQGNMK